MPEGQGLTPARRASLTPIKRFINGVANVVQKPLTEFDQLSNSVGKPEANHNMLLGPQRSSGLHGIEYNSIFNPETFQAAPKPPS